MATLEEVSELIRSAITNIGSEFRQNLDDIRNSIQQMQGPHVQSYAPVTINPLVDNNQTSLHLIKSLPEFKGEATEYPAWREAAHFAIDYYREGSENYYIAMGILRNRITGSANVALTAFNTILNFKAIIERLDQSYADKRPIHVLESELSILRQGGLSIKEFHDNVDKQLTLIVNKNKMANSNNQQIAFALNERARDNALRVFISGLRRPLCDILFSAQPANLSSALALAEEVEYNQKRQDFARAFANNNRTFPQHMSDKRTFNNNTPVIKANITPHFANKRSNSTVPMEVDPGSSFFRRQKPHSSNIKRSGFPNNSASKQDDIQMQSIRRTPFSQNKFQMVNQMQEEACLEEEGSVYEQEIDNDSCEEESSCVSTEEVNFLD